MNAFLFRIITPEKEVYSGEIESLTADTPDGKIGFLHGAMPRIIALSAGQIDFKTSVLHMSAVCGDGLIKIDRDGITVITDLCRFADDAVKESESAEPDGGMSNKAYNMAKVHIASSFKKLNDKNTSEN